MTTDIKHTETPTETPAVGGWQSPNLNPTVERGREKYFIVAVYRKHSDKVYEFPALYLNEFLLQFDDDDYPERLCTGWYQATADEDACTYQEINLTNGDELRGWCALPKWSDTPPQSEKLREALEALVERAAVVHSRGARPGPQWIKLALAIAFARQALSEG